MLDSVTVLEGINLIHCCMVWYEYFPTIIKTMFYSFNVAICILYYAVAVWRS